VEWKPPAKASISLQGFLHVPVDGSGSGHSSSSSSSVAGLEFGERLVLAGMAAAPLLATAITHLQRHLLSGELGTSL
jgi:hypothetical protein